MNLSFEQSRFKCKICDDEVLMNISDDSSYLSKTHHETFFGMELSTYRVRHLGDNEFHINSVIMDQKGLFRGYLDAYVETVNDNIDRLNAQIVEDMVSEKSVFNFFYAVDRKMSNVLIFENMEDIDTVKFINKVHNKIEEASEIYVNKNYFTFNIADLEFDVIIYNGKYLIYQLKNNNNHEIAMLVDQFITITMETYNQIALLLSIRLLCVILDAISNADKINVIYNLLANPLIFSSIDIKYPEKIPRIINRIKQNFGVYSSILSKLFHGDMNISQLIMDYPENYEQIHEVIEFINRRKLLE